MRAISTSASAAGRGRHHELAIHRVKIGSHRAAAVHVALHVGVHVVGHVRVCVAMSCVFVVRVAVAVHVALHVGIHVARVCVLLLCG